MRSEKEIKILRDKILKEIDKLELLIGIKTEIILNMQAPINLIQLPNEINSLRDEIKFLIKETNVLEGQIKVIDWFLLHENKEFI
jgi:hypothetical protein